MGQDADRHTRRRTIKGLALTPGEPLPITRTPDPLFEDAPDHGEDRRPTFARLGLKHWRNTPYGYAWRKADGTAECRGCGQTIEGRRCMVRPLARATAWHHVACVTPEQWHDWLGQPQPIKQRKRSVPGLRSQRGRKQLVQAILTPSFRFEPAPGWSP